MIKIENTETYGWGAAIRGMRNPMNSWDKSDSIICNEDYEECNYNVCPQYNNCTEGVWVNPFQSVHLGHNDLDLMKRLRDAGTDHRKFMRMITVYCDVTAPLYWWKEFDTYKVGTVANSCSTMHKIHAKEFEIDDFSHEHLIIPMDTEALRLPFYGHNMPELFLEYIVEYLNACREAYLETKNKKYWWQMIQLLPSSYNQKRTVMLNYEVLTNMYKSRKNHKLDEWNKFCDWIKTLPYSELITDERKNFADYVHAEEYK